MSSKKRQDKRQRQTILKRRDILILLSFWAVSCVMVAVLVGLFYANSVVGVPDQPRPIATYAVPFEKGTAKAAYPLALKEAQNWHSDVELIAVSTHWPEATVQDLAKAEIWDFSFFSAKHNRIFFSVVIPDKQEVTGRAHLFKSKSGTLNLINPADWVIDSDEALSIWINRGGGAFLENFPGSSVEPLLRQAPGQERPVWDIIGIGTDQSQIFYLRIDATNGEVLN